MLQATIIHRENLFLPLKPVYLIFNTTPTKQHKANIIQQQLATAEYDIAILQVQLYEFKNAHMALKKFYIQKPILFPLEIKKRRNVNHDICQLHVSNGILFKESYNLKD